MSEPPRGDQEDLKTPFSFKLMVVLTVLYLGWRLVQGIAWVIRQLG
jgi:hypothetical protein